jgi:hypothetical protein
MPPAHDRPDQNSPNRFGVSRYQQELWMRFGTYRTYRQRVAPLVSRALVPVAALVAGLFASAVRAAPVPVELKLSALRAIQTYNLDKKGDDDTYLLVTGTAPGGKEINERFPKDKTWPAAPKKPAVAEDAPVTLWKGDLDNGEFALVTVSVFQGKGTDAAKVKEYLGKLAASQKPAQGKQKLADIKEMRIVMAQTVKAEQEVVTKIKDLFSRDKNTDHYCGLFNLIVWNNNGKLVKRLDPVGLTAGEHYGTDAKIYTKLKNTRANVMVRDAKGVLAEQSLSAISDDGLTIRVKMLETEYVKTPERNVRNTTDYLAELQLVANGKPVKWSLNGEQSGVDDIHTYWDWAE